MTTVDTKYTYNPLPYNIQDKNPYNNYNAEKPSYQYKKSRIIWLNSAYATSSVSSGTTYYEFSFDIPPFQLYNRTNLKVISFVANENTTKSCYIKLKNLMYDADSTYCSDKEGFPMLYVSHGGVNGFLNNSYYSLALTPQLINNLTIKINDSFISRDTGFTISAQGVGHFIIGLLFEDSDLIADNITSQYK
jgi:hypothetical protein